MKVLELMWVGLKTLCKYGNVEVTVNYYDPADGEGGTFVEDSDVTAHVGYKTLAIDMENDVSAILLNPDAITEEELAEETANGS